MVSAAAYTCLPLPASYRAAYPRGSATAIRFVPGRSATTLTPGYAIPGYSGGSNQYWPYHRTRLHSPYDAPPPGSTCLVCSLERIYITGRCHTYQRSADTCTTYQRLPRLHATAMSLADTGAGLSAPRRDGGTGRDGKQAKDSGAAFYTAAPTRATTLKTWAALPSYHGLSGRQISLSSFRSWRTGVTGGDERRRALRLFFCNAPYYAVTCLMPAVLSILPWFASAG